MKRVLYTGFLVMGVLSVLLIGYNNLPPAADTGTSFGVMSYNVHLYYDAGTGGGNNLELVRDLIRDSGVKVVGLQESEGNRAVSSNQDGVRWLSGQLGMYFYSGPDSRDDVWGVSLLSEFPILEAETVALPSEEALNRVAIVVTLDLGDQLITVINTHLTFQSPSDQLGQVDSIIAITDDLTTPYIVMGDFNTVLAQSEESPRDITEDPSYIALTEAYRDGYVEAGGAADETTSYFFESEGLANARIDYIWLSSEWTVGASSAQVLGDESISDHRAIAIVVSL